MELASVPHTKRSADHDQQRLITPKNYSADMLTDARAALDALQLRGMASNCPVLKSHRVFHVT